jgi:hypothetical protein
MTNERLLKGLCFACHQTKLITAGSSGGSKGKREVERVAGDRDSKILGSGDRRAHFLEDPRTRNGEFWLP